ncbi:MAG TPA: glycerophosphodiester phosphodiesterase family protein [Anaerolineales bacterium]|nr:glycerophosphodiester phosphodiesterase family protein [Anaerolineales bacterium]
MDAAPLVIAHRGASAVAPENTLLAFEQALSLGADAIELDAKRSRDDEVVCFHDRTLRRTAGEDGTPGGRTLAELRSYDVGVWMGEAFSGQRVPTLSEVLEAVGRQLLVNIELTDYWADQPRLAEAVVAVVRRHRLERRVLVSSFQSSALAASEARAPEIPRAHLVGPTWLARRDRLALRRAEVQAEHLHESLAVPERIAAVQRAGKRVHVYTVDDPEAMKRLWGWGVDGLITDVPDVARRMKEAG